MCYTQRKIEGGVGALQEPDDTNFLKPNGQSRNLHIYGTVSELTLSPMFFFVLFTPGLLAALFNGPP